MRVTENASVFASPSDLSTWNVNESHVGAWVSVNASVVFVDVVLYLLTSTLILTSDACHACLALHLSGSSLAAFLVVGCYFCHGFVHGAVLQMEPHGLETLTSSELA